MFIFLNHPIRMKYIVLIAVIALIIFVKPWDISIAGVNKSAQQDTTLIPPLSERPLPLLPVNQVTNNTDSELAETQRFDRMIEQFMNKWEIKGASFALMKDNRLIYCKGYGLADAEAQIPTDVKHVFRVASVSKLITAVGIMKLVEEGKIRLNDRVFGEQGILNDSCFLDIKDPRSKKITVEQLLRHQGGYSIAYGDPMFCPLEIARKMNVEPPVDLNTMIRFVLSRRLGYSPGDGTRYSNIGYGILSKVIEKVTGKGYEEYIRKNILKPAGCSDMYLGHNLDTDHFPNEVKYYEVSNAELIPACDGSGKMVYRSNGGNNIEELYGAGGWVASPAELLRFLATIDGNPEVKDILKPETIRYMTKSLPNALPIGWIETNTSGDWSRTGTLAGTSALMKKQRDGYSWIFVTNTSSWKGSRFPHYIEAMMQKALTTVPQWPERNLFELQNMDHEKLMAIR